MTRDYTELHIWKEAYAVALDVYKVTQKFPTEEKYGLVQQLRRAGASIGANIAEGCGQKTTEATKRFFYISLGSQKETKFFLSLAKDLGYLPENLYKQLDTRIEVLGKMTYRFMTRMPSSNNTQ